MKHLKTYFSLPSAERTALRQSWILILVSKALVPVVRLPRLTAFIDHRVKAGDRVQIVRPERLAEIVGMAGRQTFGSTCLHRSLALLVLLRRQSTAARLAIGVKQDDGFGAHAWVEVAPAKLKGHPVEGQYVRLLEYEL